MEHFESVESILDRAIALEEEAYGLYSRAAKATPNDPIQQRLNELAEMELGHKAMLLEIKAGSVPLAIRRSKADPVTDLRLSDHLLGGSLGADADLGDTLLFAAHREKAAHEFYKAMAEMVSDALHRGVFEMLAAEELRHKYLVEKTYEETVYQEF